MRYTNDTHEENDAPMRVAAQRQAARVIGASQSGPASPAELTRLRLLSQLPATELEHLFALLRRRPIASQSDCGGGLKANVFFAWSGSYRVTIMSPAGAYVAIRTVLPGGHFGEIAAFAGVDYRQFHLVLDEPGTLLHMPAALFRNLVAQSAALREATCRSIAQAAILRADRIYEFATLDVKLRLLAELLRLGLQHGRWIGEHVVINPAPTQDAIATQIGATREGITRQMKSLVEQGLVKKRRGEIVLLDIERLQSMLERVSGLCASHQNSLDLC